MTESHDSAWQMRDTVSGDKPSRMIKTDRDLEDVDLIGAEVVFGTRPIGK